MTAKYDVAQISALDHERFKELLLKHMHKLDGDPALWEAVLAPELFERTSDLLRDLLDSAASSASKRKNEHNATRLECLERGREGLTDWLHADVKYQAWKSRNGNFQQMVQRRLSDVRRAKGANERAAREARRGPAAHAEAMTQERNHHLRAVRALAKMIQRHQALTAASGQSPEQHDYDLWQMLDEITVPVGQDRDLVPLRQVLETYWFETTPATLAEGRRGQAERMMRQAPAGRSPRYEGVPKVRRIDEPKRLA